MVEEWKDVVGYEGYYKVSNFGQVLSLPRGRARGGIRKLCNQRGYDRVSLCKDGKQQMYLVHRLVAEAFIPNPTDSPWVDHIDGNTKNNRVDNLRWVTPVENIDNRPAYRELKDRIEELEKQVAYLMSQA